jgi:hypothetical protein
MTTTEPSTYITNWATTKYSPAVASAVSQMVEGGWWKGRKNNKNLKYWCDYKNPLQMEGIIF